MDRDYEKELIEYGSKAEMIKFYQSDMQRRTGEAHLRVVDVRPGSVRVDVESDNPVLLNSLPRLTEKGDFLLWDNDRVAFEFSATVESPAQRKNLLPPPPPSPPALMPAAPVLSRSPDPDYQPPPDDDHSEIAESSELPDLLSAEERNLYNVVKHRQQQFGF